MSPEQEFGQQVHNVLVSAPDAAPETDSSTGPSAPKKRGARLSREALRERVLDAAEELIAAGSVSVGLHHLNMEELIRRVGVPRSSAFAAFGGKDNLLTELMLRMLQSGEAGMPVMGFSPEISALAQDVFERYAPRMHDAAGDIDAKAAADVMDEAIRVSLEQNVLDTMASAQWRTYMALSVSVSSLPEAQQPRAREALRIAEEQFLRTLAGVYERMVGVLGRELTPGVTWMQLAAIGASVVEGMASKRLIGVADVADTVTRPGIDGEPVEWDVTAFAFAAMAKGLTRPIAREH